MAQMEVTLVIVLGTSWEELQDYAVGIDPQTMTELRNFDGTFALGNPTSFTLVLAPDFEFIDRSVNLELSDLIPRLISLSNVQVRIHESAWSKDLADHLIPLPSSVRNVTLTVSDLRPGGCVLFCAQFNADAVSFTTSLVASFLGLDLVMNGYLSDLPFMFNMLRRLGRVKLNSNTAALIQFSRHCSLYLRMSGGIGDIMGVLGCITRNTQRTIHSLSATAPMLHEREEFSNFLSALSTQAPDLQNLTIRIDALHQKETGYWMEGVQKLVHLCRLTHVDIVHPRPLPLLDTEFGELIRSWQNAEYISLNPKPSQPMTLTLGQASLTRNALKAAAHAPPSLRYLGLDIVGRRIPVYGSRNARPQYSVTVVEVGVTRSGSIQRTREVVAVAKKMFPNAQVVQV